MGTLHVTSKPTYLPGTTPPMTSSNLELSSLSGGPHPSHSRGSWRGLSPGGGGGGGARVRFRVTYLPGTTPPKTSSNLELSSLSWGPHPSHSRGSWRGLSLRRGIVPLSNSKLLSTHKDRRPTNQQPGIYQIPCECGKGYIGETGHSFTARLKEHQAKREKSAIFHHAHTNGHRVLWDESKLHNSVKHWHTQRVREALEIHLHDTVLQDIGLQLCNICLISLNKDKNTLCGHP